MAQQKTGLSVIQPAFDRAFASASSALSQKIFCLTMAAITPNTTRYFPHPAQFPSHTNEQYLQEAHSIASQCWLHYADPSSRSYGTLYTGALGSLCFPPSCSSLPPSFLPGSTTLKALACVDDALAQATRRNIRCTLLECPTTSSLCLKLALLVKVDQIEEARSIGNEILRLAQSCAMAFRATPTRFLQYIVADFWSRMEMDQLIRQHLKRTSASSRWHGTLRALLSITLMRSHPSQIDPTRSLREWLAW